MSYLAVTHLRMRASDGFQNASNHFFPIVSALIHNEEVSKLM